MHSAIRSKVFYLYRKEAVDDVVVTQEQVEKIANQIEVKLYNLHGDINTKYKTKYRSLLFNLKDTKNQVMRCLLFIATRQILQNLI